MHDSYIILFIYFCNIIKQTHEKNWRIKNPMLVVVLYHKNNP